MKNLTRRVAALTSSFTVALILFTVGLTGMLAYRAFDASRAQRQLTERTLRDYAGFAAFQLKTATISTLSGRHRQLFDNVVRSIVAPAARPMGARQLASIVESRRTQFPLIDSVSFYYQITFADSAIEASPSPLATPANLRRLRDTVMAPAVVAGRRDQFFVPIFLEMDGRPYVFVHMLSFTPPYVAYGYATPAKPYVGSAVRAVLMTQPILPRTLMRDLAIDSILAIDVTAASRHPIYENGPVVNPRFAADDSLDSRLGGLHFRVSISEAAASRLIIGGLPRSRLPEVLATALIAVLLLGLLMFQFRRQEELGRLRDDFVSGVSHELRTPLAQIRLLAELLRMGKVPTAEDKDRSLRIIDQEARRLSFLVESILSFTRADAAQLAPVSTDVAAEIEEIVRGFEPLAQSQSVNLTTRLERGLTAQVDRGALRQVLLNLLDNAVRYGPAGQNVSVTTASAGDAWTIEVADEGPGIPADERERIFAPYYRMKRDAGGAVGGTGIGLAVVRRLVEQHGGEVHVSGVNGTGARFVVTLPRGCHPEPLVAGAPRDKLREGPARR